MNKFIVFCFHIGFDPIVPCNAPRQSLPIDCLMARPSPHSYLLKYVTYKRKLSGSLQHNFSNFAQARARVGNMKVSSLRECSTYFSNISCMFLNPNIFLSNLNSNCSDLLDLRELQEQVQKHSVTAKRP